MNYDQPPRKVIVGTMQWGFWGEYPGLEARLDELAALVGNLAAKAQGQYGRGLDLVVLPEQAVTDHGPEPLARAIPFAGAVQGAFVELARHHGCYVVVPMDLREEMDGTTCCFNAAVLVDRQGETAGVYRKLHLAVDGSGSEVMEGGATPGREVPVFQCDFGRLGMQICFDMEFEYGWRELARQAAEIVVWPTMSPQTQHPCFRAMTNGCYVISSTWRNNASICEPTGKITAQVKSPAHFLVQEIDLSYAILPWSVKLNNGAALRERYGERVGFRYYEEEDCGIFWSNDEDVTIGQMIREIGVVAMPEERARIQKLYERLGVGRHAAGTAHRG